MKFVYVRFFIHSFQGLRWKWNVSYWFLHLLHYFSVMLSSELHNALQDRVQDHDKCIHFVKIQQFCMCLYLGNMQWIWKWNCALSWLLQLMIFMIIRNNHANENVICPSLTSTKISTIGNPISMVCITLS
jgi:hypothetical protein